MRYLAQRERAGLISRQEVWIGVKGREYTESRIDWNRQSYSKVISSRFGHWMFFDVDFGSELGFRSLGGAIPPPNAVASWGPWTLRHRVFLTKNEQEKKKDEKRFLLKI